MNDEQLFKEYFAKIPTLKTIEDCQILRSEISGELERRLFPLTRTLDAVITGNSDLIEILAPEMRVTVDLIFEIMSFKPELKPKGLKDREKYQY